MSKSRLCIDIDNVVAQTDAVMRQVIKEFTGGHVDLDYKHIVKFEYEDCRDAHKCGITKEEWKAIHELFSEDKYLLAIEPVPDVQRVLRRLGDQYVLHLATSRLAKARRGTITWLEQHAFPPHDLHFLKHREKHSSLGKFAAAVEDHYEQAADFAKDGTHCYLIRHPWNENRQSVEKVHWVSGWDELERELLASPVASP
jgi:uncharacterized HAD superfamily protein